MKTDSIFYEIFQTYPDIFFELIGNPNPRASTYSFTSQEVKQTRFQIDGILIPPIYASNLPIYFVEVQGYQDKDVILDKDLLVYIGQMLNKTDIWKQNINLIATSNLQDFFLDLAIVTKLYIYSYVIIDTSDSVID